MNTTENLRFSNAKFKFFDEIVVVEVYVREEAEIYPLTTVIECWPLELQVSSVAHIFNSLSQGFPAVQHLALERAVPSWSSEEYHWDAIHPTEWHNLLGSFSNAKTLCVDDGPVEEISRFLRRFLRPGDGEPLRGLLPKLQELTYCSCSRGNTRAPFTPFIDTRGEYGTPYKPGSSYPKHKLFGAILRRPRDHIGGWRGWG
jgi:hypothetical protein